MISVEEVRKDYPDFEINDDVRKIIDTINDGKCLLNIIGKAGVGKSYLLVHLKLILESKGYSVAVCSSTGVASALLNSNHESICANTLHSALRIHPQNILGDFDPKNKKLIGKQKVGEFINAMDYLFIDEVSLVTSDMFDYIMEEIRHFRKKKKKFPNIILFGDILQLPPIIKNDPLVKEYYSSKYDGKYFYFNSMNFSNMGFKTIELTKIYRQKDDVMFTEVLNRIRYGKVSKDDLKLINTRALSIADGEKWIGENESVIRLCTRNADCQVYNDCGMDLLASKKVTYASELKGDFEQSDEFKSGQYPREITLKKGAKVMITRNARSDCEGKKEYVNGDIGIIESLKMTTIDVRLSDGRIVHLGKEKVSCYQYDIQVNDDKTSFTPVEKGSWTNFPVKICYAITPWKAQGSTLPKGSIELSSWQPDASVYVSLSRFRHLDDFILSRPLTERDVSVSSEPLEFLNSLND